MRRKEWNGRLAAGLLIVFLMLFTACGESDPGQAADPGEGTAQAEQTDPAAAVARAEKETAAKLIETITAAGEAGPGNEWSIIGIARSSLGKDPQAQVLFSQYEENLCVAVKRSEGVLDPERPTDNARAAIALQLIGGDPADVEGYDLLDQQEEVKAVQAQGINAEIWALNAAQCCGRELAAADTYLEDICSMAAEDGGITFDGKTADVDITAMALQALAPYRDERPEVDEAVTAAADWLADQQAESGDYGNSESTSQVILAAAALGEDPAASEAFTKNGKNLVDGQLLYQRDGGFCHLDEEEMDVMATEQALCALDTIELAAQGERLF